MMIEFSKVWGQDGCRWNYCGGDWNFATIGDFMNFYGIKEARIIGKDGYYKDENDEMGKECFTYVGFATKHYALLLKHWHVEYCNPCRYSIGDTIQ